MNRQCSQLQSDATGTCMLRNLSPMERWVRVLGGAVLMVLWLTFPVPFWVEEVAETVGLLAAVTGAVGYCPVKHLCVREADKGRRFHRRTKQETANPDEGPDGREWVAVNQIRTTRCG